jgi:hypothetical protein
MIVVKLMGGLGNQMFQFAAGKALSQHLDVSLKLDTTFLLDRSFKKDFTYRNYELAPFELKQDILSKKELRTFFMAAHWIERLKGNSINTRLFNSKIPLPNIYRNHNNSFDKNFFSLPNNTYIEGYWQALPYFKSYEREIRASFQIKPSLLEQHTLPKISGPTSVSVHIRRGDYAANNHINSVHGLCDINYYFKAMDYIASHIEGAVFYFFSDDMPWVKKTFSKAKNTYNIVFIDAQALPHFEMLLMTQCSHNIIANSSFSWWGAWLNENASKIVISPNRWFADSNLNAQTKELIPETWRKI